MVRGRFAPSPTGPLHFGSLVAAVGSFLEARRHGGEWLVRIEDVDGPRARPGAADLILRTLERYALLWNGPVLYQSQRGEIYRAALERLVGAGLAYPCTCTRRELAAYPRSRDGSPIYPGHCRKQPSAISAPACDSAAGQRHAGVILRRSARQPSTVPGTGHRRLCNPPSRRLFRLSTWRWW
jgi:glutamyl-Q tRNA(Asp) synthetase